MPHHVSVSLTDAAADLLLGARCPGCGRPGWRCCLACRRFVATSVPTLVYRGLSLPPVVACGPYDGVLAGLISAHKERAAQHVRGILATALADAVACGPLPSLSGRCILVPVPSRRSALRRRGYDATYELARATDRALARRGSAHPALPLLKVGPVADQAGLSAAARLANVTGAFEVRVGDLAGVSCVVVDDVITTGATVLDATRALTSAGAEVRAVVTLATQELHARAS